MITLALTMAVGSARAEGQAAQAAGPFLVKPYLQLGRDPAPGTVEVVWQAAPGWEGTVEYTTGPGKPWKAAPGHASTKVAVRGAAPYEINSVRLVGLELRGTFSYRVRQGSRVVFQAEARPPKGPDEPHRFVAFGDCGAGTPEQGPIAHRAFLAEPDFLMIPGDIVYSRGLASEYRTRFWPLYNADSASPKGGVPLLRSTLFVAAPGNHDIATRDLDKYPDGLAYFYNWRQPLNGPVGPEGGPLVGKVTGSDADRAAFLAAAGESFPRMANFSFDYGNAHWTVLDANAYVDWASPAFRDWVARDLAAASAATWRFVCYHQPGFNSSKAHFDEQATRLLAPTFEAGKVDVVFNGHVHNYQRTFPLRFVPEPGAAPTQKSRRIDGRWSLDRAFDGRADTTPDGVIYLVTGAGGAKLYNPEQQDDPGSWQPFTEKFVSKVHSLTVADVDGPTLTVRQVAVNGEELDRFVVTKPGPPGGAARPR